MHLFQINRVKKTKIVIENKKEIPMSFCSFVYYPSKFDLWLPTSTIVVPKPAKVPAKVPSTNLTEENIPQTNTRSKKKTKSKKSRTPKKKPSQKSAKAK